MLFHFKNSQVFLVHPVCPVFVIDTAED